VGFRKEKSGLKPSSCPQYFNKGKRIDILLRRGKGEGKRRSCWDVRGDKGTGVESGVTNVSITLSAYGGGKGRFCPSGARKKNGPLPTRVGKKIKVSDAGMRG